MTQAKKLDKWMLKFGWYGQVRLAIIVLYRVVEVLALSGTGGWLVYISDDTITIAVGLLIAGLGLVKLVHATYQAEASQK